MFTKKMKYKNNDIKLLYKTVLLIHPAVADVIKEIRSTSNELKVTKVTNDLYTICIILDSEKSYITVKVDLLNNKIRVIDDSLPYIKAYNNYHRKSTNSASFEYQNNKREVIRNSIVKNVMDNTKRFSYVIMDQNKVFDIIVDSELICFDEDELVNSFLDYNESITNINVLLTIITKNINIENVNISILDETGNLIIMKKGQLSNYVELTEENGEKKKIYWKNNGFYVERIANEKCVDTEPLIKKIGVYNGKEKR